MNNLYDLNKLISRYAPKHKGVFTLSDLKNLFNDFANISFFRKIKKLEKQNILRRFCKGFYVAENYDIELLSAKINKNSYISFGNVLAKELLIGSIPQYTIRCVKLGRNRSYGLLDKKIIYFSIAEHLFFGYKTREGVNSALKEKAFLDTLYYYQKGYIFSFNIFTDINISLLETEVVMQYLKKYRNPKFIQFVKGYLNERI